MPGHGGWGRRGLLSATHELEIQDRTLQLPATRVLVFSADLKPASSQPRNPSSTLTSTLALEPARLCKLLPSTPSAARRAGTQSVAAVCCPDAPAKVWRGCPAPAAAARASPGLLRAAPVRAVVGAAPAPPRVVSLSWNCRRRASDHDAGREARRRCDGEVKRALTDRRRFVGATGCRAPRAKPGRARATSRRDAAAARYAPPCGSRSRATARHHRARNTGDGTPRLRRLDADRAATPAEGAPRGLANDP